MANDKPQKEKTANVRGLVIFWIGLCFSVFQLIVPVFLNLIDLQLKSLHIIFGASLALLAYSFKKKAQAGARTAIWDWLLIAILLAANINIFLNWMNIYAIPGSGTPKDWVLGALVILTVLEAGRRSTGWVMPAIFLATFVYVFMGPLIPGSWGHPGFSFEFVMESVYYSPLGMYGSITGFSSTFVAVFIIFGAILLRTGGGKTFMDLALLLSGRYRGGPAKVAVVSSALFGTISGSPSANVSVTGNYTIPLMKRLGYNPNFAGGVEAMASTGGIITPPIMGITAFIMAELIGIPYIKIAWYATIPCLLYYIGVFAGVHFEALRLGLTSVPKEEVPHWRSVITWPRLVPFVIPIFILIWLLLRAVDLTEAGFWSCVAALFFYIFSNLSPSGIKERAIQAGKALSEGGQTLSILVPVMVIVGMLVNLLGITGVAPKISELILDIGGKYLVGGLLTACIVPLILGTALPTSASYILAAALVAPALLGLNLDLVSVHMFIFYWAALAAVTPPTCVPAVIAANIGGGNWLKVAFVGMRLGIVAFLMPFFFILEPALLARGATIDILIHFASASAGAVLLAAALFGYMMGRTNPVFRLLYGAAGVLLLFPGYQMSLLGLGIAALALIGDWLLIRFKRTPRQASQ